MIEKFVVGAISNRLSRKATLEVSKAVADKFLTRFIKDDFSKGLFCGEVIGCVAPIGAGIIKDVYYMGKSIFIKTDISDKKKEEEQKKAKDEAFFKQYESYRAEFETA